MKLILAQGNPGSEFSGTRHNVGFALLDAYAHTRGAEWAEKSKFHACIAEFTHAGEKVLLVKPTTYYNETGQAARELVDFYKVTTSDVLVIHDEIALPLGTIRTREKGSDAGNNGIKSLNSHLGQDFKRVRVGIHTELAARMDTSAYVLGKFTSDEQAVLAELHPKVIGILDSFLNDTFELTSHK